MYNILYFCFTKRDTPLEVVEVELYCSFCFTERDALLKEVEIELYCSFCFTKRDAPLELVEVEIYCSFCFTERDAPLEVVEVEMRCGETIPNEADFLMGYATVPGFVSYRSKTSGSWYIKTLTQMLEKYARK